MHVATRAISPATGCLNRSLFGSPLPQTTRGGVPVSLKRQRTRRRSQQNDRDHASPGWGDPHQTSPPPPPTDTLSSSDLEFGADALSGGTLETTAQLKRHHQDAGLQRPGLASEGQAYKDLAADESTAAERQERYQGILQAMDSLQPFGTGLPKGGASDDEGGRQPSADAGRASGGAALDAERRFNELRRTVDRLGVGEEAADLIRRSYEGRDLEAEAHATIDPADGMPHPGNRYLPQHAVPPRKPAATATAMAARLGDAHSRPHFEHRRGGFSSSPSRSSGSGGESLRPGSAAAAPSKTPVPSDDGGSTQADVEQEAMRGADAMYYAAEHASTPAAGEHVAGPPGGNSDDQDAYDVEGDALRGSDAMYYFKAPLARSSGRSGAAGGGLGRKAAQRGAVWAALNGGRDKAKQGSDTSSSASDKAAAGGSGKQGGSGGGLHGGDKAAAAAHRGSRVQGQLQHQPRGPRAGLGGVVEAASGRAAAVGLGSALFSELLTQQSVLSQLLGRWEGPRQIEFALPACRALAVAVLIGAAVVTVSERLSGSGATPRWNPLRLSPLAQLWTGRAAMLLFAFLLAYETVHSNRPAFATLFYLWF